MARPGLTGSRNDRILAPPPAGDSVPTLCGFSVGPAPQNGQHQDKGRLPASPSPAPSPRLQHPGLAHHLGQRRDDLAQGGQGLVDVGSLLHGDDVAGCQVASEALAPVGPRPELSCPDGRPSAQPPAWGTCEPSRPPHPMKAGPKWVQEINSPSVHPLRPPPLGVGPFSPALRSPPPLRPPGHQAPLGSRWW